LKNIAVIGAGNIGRRHLQALSNLDSAYSLFVVDPVKEAIDLSMKMFKEVKKSSSPELQTANDIRELPQILFTAIVATNSEQRYLVAKSLLEKEIQYILFEKILFQNPNEYLKIEKWLLKKNIKSWVNCWRRAVPFFQELVNINQYGNFISLSAEGNNWGMASNAIHFIDLLSCITELTDYELTENNIEIITGKRINYSEFVGLIKGSFGSGLIPFSFESSNTGEDAYCEITLEYENKTLIINSGHGWWIEKSFNNHDIKHKIKLPNQSEITHLHIKDLLEIGSCRLTPFSESCKLHLPMIDYFTSIFKTNNILGCPIT
jgi:hypothetical protein